MKPLEGKVAFITGGVRGIGLATSEALAEWGSDIIAADICYDDESISELGRKYGVRAETVYLDVANTQQIQELAPKLFQKYGKIDIIVNSAGVGPTTPLMEVDEKHWDWVQNINLKGTFFVCQTIARLMIEHKTQGRIVNISSMAAERGGYAASAAYVASKGGVIAITKKLARHLAPEGITVNCVTPGIIETEMTLNWPDDIKGRLLSEIPMERLCAPREVATVIRFLVSDDASYINGDTIRVNGGQYF